MKCRDYKQKNKYETNWKEIIEEIIEEMRRRSQLPKGNREEETEEKSSADWPHPLTPEAPECSYILLSMTGMKYRYRQIDWVKPFNW